MGMVMVLVLVLAAPKLRMLSQVGRADGCQRAACQGGPCERHRRFRQQGCPKIVAASA